jgi:hypothetical protein
MLRKIFLFAVLAAGTLIVPAIATQSAEAAPVYRHGHSVRYVNRGCYPVHYNVHYRYCR